MKAPNRDLLVLTGKVTMNAEEFEHQLELLNDLLYDVENLNVFCTANEIIDISKNKIIQKQHVIQRLIKHKKLKPFVFINNKN